MKKLIYGVIFWNEETDDEICAWFEADNWYAADDVARPYQLPSFVKGEVHYIADSVAEVHSEFDQVYTTRLEAIK